jgi:glycosyltransferase involved in cell wall biosynthesis
MLLSLIIPVYNEEEAFPFLLAALRKVLAEMTCEYEIVFVNDGSRDRSLILLQEAAQDPRIKVLSFSRNFGHQAAITAGLDFASGDAIAVLDADLQDPPEILKEMIARYQEGYDVVSAQRSGRKSDSFFKRFSAAGFYWVMRTMVDQRIVPEVGDFRLFSRPALMAIRAFREQHRFMRGLVAWLGLKEVIVPFERKSRVAGETKYPLLKMLKFSWTAISSFSALPLRLSMALGILFSMCGLGYLIYTLWVVYVRGNVVQGWASVVVLQCLLSGTTLFVLGLVGDYVAKIFEETKLRPLYVVDRTFNIVHDTPIARAVVLQRSERGVSQ